MHVICTVVSSINCIFYQYLLFFTQLFSLLKYHLLTTFQFNEIKFYIIELKRNFESIYRVKVC